MAIEKEFDLNTKIGKQVVTLEKNEDFIINFKNDVKSSQVDYKISGNDIVLNTYGQCTNAYAKVVTTSSLKPNKSGLYTFTQKIYLYDYDKNEFSTKACFTVTYTNNHKIDGEDIFYTPVDIGIDGKYYNKGYFTAMTTTSLAENYREQNGKTSAITDILHSTGTIFLKNAKIEGEAKSIKLIGENEKINVADLFEEDYIIELSLNKKLNYKGSFLNEYIYGGNKADKITTGAGNDVVVAGKGKDTITVDGSGEKELVFIDGDGNDTVIMNNNTAEVELDLSEKNEGIDEYTKSGNDLIITTFYENAKGKEIKETVTVKNVFDATKCDISKVSVKDYSLKSLDDELNSTTLTVKGVRNVFEGSKYKDEIVGTKKADTITTGNGDDEIYAGKGNDTVTINGSGTKKISIGNGDGNDKIIYSYNGAATANLVMNSTNTYFFKDTEGGVDIVRMYDSKGVIKKETTFVTKNNNLSVQINGTDISDMPKFEEDDIDELGSSKDAEIYGGKVIVIGNSKANKISLSTKDSVVFAGNGDDEITVSERNGESNTSAVSGGKGNDIINFDMKGKAVVNHVSGDGNDTVSLLKKPSDLTINVDYTIPGKNEYEMESKNMYYEYSGKNGLHKSGNDLIIATPAGWKKGETITIKDYFADVNNMPDGDVKINQTMHYGPYSESGVVTVKNLMNDSGIWADGVTDEATGITTCDAYGEYQNRYNYSGGGKTIFNGGVKDDIYFATLGKKSDLYIDTGNNNIEDNDSLIINANYKNVRAFFNIDSYGDVVVTGDDISDNLMIFNKKSLTADNIKKMFDDDDTTDTQGVISINKFFTNSGYDYGYMENFTVSNNFLNNVYNYLKGGYKKVGEIDTEDWLSEVKESVSAWLVDNGYDSAFDVINSGIDKDINAMLKVYQSVDNGAIFGDAL